MTTGTDVTPTADNEPRQSLSTAAARNLATTTKSVPQMQGISSRWVLRMLPWLQVEAGTYRVNRRLTYAVGRGRLSFVKTGDDVRLLPPSLAELPLLRGVTDEALLTALAARFVRREIAPGELLARQGTAIDEVVVVAHGRIEKLGTGKYGGATKLGVVADGDHIGDEVLVSEGSVWGFTARAETAATVLTLRPADFTALAEGSDTLRERIRGRLSAAGRAQDKHGQAEIGLAAGHRGEPDLPATFVDYELKPREYELSVAQTVLRVHSRVADLYNGPMDQTEQQLRLTIHALRERQEFEMVNNRDIGLLHNADYEQRIRTHSGPPTPDDMDDLLSMRRSTHMFFAHPKAIAAFFRECNKRGIPVNPTEVDGHRVPAWRGVPIFPCGKIPISEHYTSSIIAVRTGADDQGVVGLHQIGIPDEHEPGLNVRFMGIDAKAVISYLVSTYYSVAILVPDAIGILEDCDIAAPRS